jgi:hypothetical protein
MGLKRTRLDFGEVVYKINVYDVKIVKIALIAFKIGFKFFF